MPPEKTTGGRPKQMICIPGRCGRPSFSRWQAIKLLWMVNLRRILRIRPSPPSLDPSLAKTQFWTNLIWERFGLLEWS
jgi:hypothetical protein